MPQFIGTHAQLGEARRPVQSIKPQEPVLGTAGKNQVFMHDRNWSGTGNTPAYRHHPPHHRGSRIHLIRR